MMWKEITDAQRDGRKYLVTREDWGDAQILWLKDISSVLRWGDYTTHCWAGNEPTHYWDFGLDTPLPPPPKGA